jgi:hypothetical protein
MYCSTCGVAVAETLSYCNHCGARIISPNSDKLAISRPVRPEPLIAAMVATFVVGLIAITALLGVMKSVLGLESGQILGFAMLSFFIMIFLEGVFLFLLFRRNRDAEERRGAELLAGNTTRELGVPQVQALREPLSSVTDETTRTFEPIYSNRNKTIER